MVRAMLSVAAVAIAIPTIAQVTKALIDGPINGECFRAYVEQQLVPVLKPGDIVVMDNLAAHKVHGVRTFSLDSQEELDKTAVFWEMSLDRPLIAGAILVFLSRRSA